MAEGTKALNWRRSSWCGTTACVEVAVTTAGDVLVRDARGAVLAFDPQDWAAFVNLLRGGGPRS